MEVNTTSYVVHVMIMYAASVSHSVVYAFALLTYNVIIILHLTKPLFGRTIHSDADAMGSGYCKSAAGPSGVCSAALLVNQPSDLTVDSSGDSDDLSDVKDADIANYIASSKEVHVYTYYALA